MKTTGSAPSTYESASSRAPAAAAAAMSAWTTNNTAYGPLWSHIWTHLGPYGPIWALMGPPGQVLAGPDMSEFRLLVEFCILLVQTLVF